MYNGLMKLFKINPIRIIKISGFTSKILSLWYLLNILFSFLLVFTKEGQDSFANNRIVFITNILSSLIINGLYGITFYGYSKLIGVFTSTKGENNEKGS